MKEIRTYNNNTKRSWYGTFSTILSLFVHSQYDVAQDSWYWNLVFFFFTPLPKRRSSDKLAALYLTTLVCLSVAERS